ncbi:LOW QUALITY PROTEIN: hypothetical protein V2J09_023389 [Rumex salicifolius]
MGGTIFNICLKLIKLSKIVRANDISLSLPHQLSQLPVASFSCMTTIKPHILSWILAYCFLTYFRSWCTRASTLKMEYLNPGSRLSKRSRDLESTKLCNLAMAESFSRQDLPSALLATLIGTQPRAPTFWKAIFLPPINSVKFRVTTPTNCLMDEADALGIISKNKYRSRMITTTGKYASTAGSKISAVSECVHTWLQIRLPNRKLEELSCTHFQSIQFILRKPFIRKSKTIRTKFTDEIGDDAAVGEAAGRVSKVGFAVRPIGGLSHSLGGVSAGGVEVIVVAGIEKRVSKHK